MGFDLKKDLECFFVDSNFITDSKILEINFDEADFLMKESKNIEDFVLSLKPLICRDIQKYLASDD